MRLRYISAAIESSMCCMSEDGQDPTRCCVRNRASEREAARAEIEMAIATGLRRLVRWRQPVEKYLESRVLCQW